MIKINLLGKSEGFKLPTILGMDLSQISIPAMLLVALVWFCADTILYSSWNEDVLKAKNKVSAAQTKLKKIERDIKKNAGVKAQLEEFKKQLAHLKSRREQVDKIFKNRSNPYKVLERLARNMPKDLWLNEIELTKDKKIILRGAATSHRSIGTLITDANEASYFGKSLFIKDVNTVEEKNGDDVRRVEKFVIEGQVISFDPWGN